MSENGSGESEPGESVDDSGECAFCRQPIPMEPVLATTGRGPVTCCSEACREAIVDGEDVFSRAHGQRRVAPDIAAFDASLPQGLPRNAFVLVSGEVGTRDRAVGAELVWRTLERGEPAVVVSFQEPPGSIVQQFLTLDWNVLPYLEAGQLHVLDCFTYRVSDRDRMFDRMDAWNAHLYDVAKGATTTVRDPSDIGELQNKLDNVLETLDMASRGIVLVDSLTELGTLVQPVQAYNFAKDVRADICKGRAVPVFAGGTRAGDGEGFPHDLAYVADGLVDLRLTEELVADTLIKQARIRKLSGVLVIPKWHAYEYTAGLGMVTFDPLEEIRNSEGERAGEREDGPEGKHEEGRAVDGDSSDSDTSGDGDGDGDGAQPQ